MSGDLQNWPREYFTASTGEAFLLFVAFGNVAQNKPLDSAYYRCRGIPDGFELMAYSRDKQPDVFALWQTGYLWDQLQQDNPRFAQQIGATPACLMLRGSIPNPQNLNYLRDAVGLLTYFLDNGACAIYDPQMLQWWSANEWRDRVFAAATAVPLAHTVILASPEEGTDRTWFHTRGMRKFGRPDLSVRQVAPEYHKEVVDLCERFIVFQARGGVIAEGQEVRLASLPPGGIARHGGDLDDPDFNNVHVEIVWPADC